MMSSELESDQILRQSNALKKELVVSLKFHHAKTLQNMPLEAALEAMKEAWQVANRTR
jgi:hypothetical protein